MGHPPVLQMNHCQYNIKRHNLVHRFFNTIGCIFSDIMTLIKTMSIYILHVSNSQFFSKCSLGWQQELDVAPCQEIYSCPFSGQPLKID